MYCSNCGHEIADGAQFCGFCGAKMMPRSETAAAASRAQAAEETCTEQTVQSVPEKKPVDVHRIVMWTSFFVCIATDIIGGIPALQLLLNNGEIPTSCWVCLVIMVATLITSGQLGRILHIIRHTFLVVATFIPYAGLDVFMGAAIALMLGVLLMFAPFIFIAIGMIQEYRELSVLRSYKNRL